MLVYESLDALLKPKVGDEIFSEVIPLIDDFINRISKDDFEESFLDDESLKKIKIGKHIEYLHDTEAQLNDTINSLINSQQYNQWGETIPRFPKLSYFESKLYDFNDENLIIKYYDIIKERLKKKFIFV